MIKNVNAIPNKTISHIFKARFVLVLKAAIVNNTGITIFKSAKVICKIKEKIAEKRKSHSE